MALKFIFCLAVAILAAIPANSCPVSCPQPYLPPCLPPCPPPCLPPCPAACPPPCVPASTSTGSSQVFPVILDNCGPSPSPLPVQNAPHQQLPCIHKPAIALPACIPAPKTVSNIANCLKTIVKPQIYQQLISVPSLQKYIETSHIPVVENIHYHGVPINCPPVAPEIPACLPPLPAPAPCLPAIPPCAPAFAPCLPPLPAPAPCFLAPPPCLPSFPAPAPCLPPPCF